MRVRFSFSFPLREPMLRPPYPPSDELDNYLETVVSSLVKPSERFLKKYGADWDIRITVGVTYGKDFFEPLVSCPKADKRFKWIEFVVLVPSEMHKKLDEHCGAHLMGIYFDSIVMRLEQLGIECSELIKARLEIISRVGSSPMMLEDMGLLPQTMRTEFHKVSTPLGLSAAPRESAPDGLKDNKTVLSKVRRLPQWKIPKSLARVLKEKGEWESNCFEPILLMVSSNTSFEGRDVQQSWQIEFHPADEHFNTANERIREMGLEPDGDGWSEVIEQKFKSRFPNLAKEFHSDSESSTCVLWVESETTCKKLIEIIWPFIDA